MVVQAWTSSGQGGLTYSPGKLIAHRWFRLKVTNVSCSIVKYSNVIDVFVRDSINAGSITASTTEICYNTGTNLSLTKTSGGDSNYVYTWEQLTSGTNTWSVATGAKNSTSYSTGLLLVSHDYRVRVRSGCGVEDTSSISKVDVAKEFISGTISGVDTICYGSAALLTSTGFAGGRLPYSYQWQSKSSSGTNWVNVGTDSSNYQETNSQITSHYRVNVTSSQGCGMKSSTVKLVVVRDSIVPSIISSSQIICYNTLPKALTRTSATGADSSFIYDWEWSSNGSSGWTSSGQGGLTYSPGKLIAHRWFRLKVTNVSCSIVKYSNVIDVFVRDSINAGSITASTTEICYNTGTNLSLLKPQGVIVIMFTHGSN